jgi:protein SCO1/2
MKVPPPTSRRTARRGWLTAIVAAMLLLGASAGLFILIRSDTGEQAARATIGGPFRLIDSHHRTVTDRDFRSRYLLVYFGYTGCPDVCPTTLASVVQALRLLGARGAAIQPIFITVDPKHDTPGVMQGFVASFSPRLIGLTGSPSQLKAVERAYHVAVDVTATGIDHSAVLYLMAPDGQFLAPLPADGSAAVIATDLDHDTT